MNFLSHESRLCELENNPFDVISIVNNYVGQANQSPININPICYSKYVSDLGGEEVTKGNYSLTALQLNIQGLSSSIDNLRQIVSDGQPDVVGLCETFLDSGNEMLLDIHGYKMERINRCKMAKGGLAMYISCNLHYCLRDDLSRNFEGIFESQFIEIRSNGIDLIIGNIYRSPSGAISLFFGILRKYLT